MYKHILVATDGSKLAVKGARAAVKLAKPLGAKITGVYVAPPFAPPIRNEAASRYSGSFSRSRYGKIMKALARQALCAVARAARAEKVPCRTRLLIDPLPWHGILRAARAGKCDLIAIGSHGRNAFGSLVLGSETNRVLAHSKIPVLVAR